MGKLIYSAFGYQGDANYSWWEHIRFKYIECYHVTHELDWELQFETQWFNELWMVRRGRCEIWSGEKHDIAEVGDYVVIPRGFSRLTRSIGPIPLELSGFHFFLESDHCRNVVHLFDIPLCVKFPEGAVPRYDMAALFDQLVTDTLELGPGYNFSIPALAQLIVGEIVRAGRPPGEKTDEFVQHLQTKLRQVVSDDIADVLDYIHRFYSRHTLSLEDLATAAHRSTSYLSRKFKLSQGIAPMGYLRSFRLHRAREQLRNNNKSIAQIALDCGFDDPSYFGREFKYEFGITPRDFRKKSIESE